MTKLTALPIVLPIRYLLSVPLFMCTVLCLSLYAQMIHADELFLEGVSILGNKKSASVVHNDQSLSLRQGDKVGDWVLERIEQRSIYLKDKAGKLQVLELHSSVSSGNTNVASDDSKPEKHNSFKPRVIKDEDVPEGHRKIKTPFGDVLIKDTPATPVPR